MRTTKTDAQVILNLWKNETNYFNETLTEAQFENMLRYQYPGGSWQHK